MARYHFEPQETGWIGIQDMWNQTLARIDCRNGGAQQAFDVLCQDLERAGWQLEKRSFDWRFVRRGGVRWEIRIGVLAPGEKVRSSHGDGRWTTDGP
jgi:hypothetical protein